MAIGAKLKAVFGNKKHRTFALLCAAVVFLLVFACVAMAPCTKTEGAQAPTASEMLESGVVVQQELKGDGSTMSLFTLTFVNHDKAVQGDLTVALYENDVCLQMWEKRTEALATGERSFSLDAPLTLREDARYKVTVLANAEGADSAMAVQVGLSGKRQGDCYVGDRLLEAHGLVSAFKVKDAACYSVDLLHRVLFFGLALLLIGASWMLIYSRIKLEVMLTLLVFILGMFFMITITPRATPDEPHHYHTSYELSNYMLFRFDSLNKGTAEHFDATDLPGHANTSAGYLRVFSEFGEGVEDTEAEITIPEKRKLSYFVEYIPQAIGILIGRLLGRNAVTLYILGRFCNLLFYTVCVYFALRRLPKFKLQLGLIAMLPMALHQGASLSYDAFVNGMSFLFIALVLSFVFERRPIGVKDLCIIGVVAALLVPAKVVYCALLLLLFLIRKEQFGSMKKKILSIGVIFAICAIVLLAFQLPSMLEISSRGDTKLNHEGLYNYTLSDFLRDPVHAVMLFIRTFWEMAYTWLCWGIGSLLCGLNLQIPMWIVVGFMIILVLSTISNAESSLALKRYERLLCVGISAAVILLTMLSMAVGWTGNTHAVIQGVQGRYFLPVFPLLLLSLCGSKTFTLQRNIDRQLIFAAVVLCVTTVSCVVEYTVVH